MGGGFCLTLTLLTNVSNLDLVDSGILLGSTSIMGSGKVEQMLSVDGCWTEVFHSLVNSVNSDMIIHAETVLF